MQKEGFKPLTGLLLSLVVFDPFGPKEADEMGRQREWAYSHDHQVRFEGPQPFDHLENCHDIFRSGSHAVQEAHQGGHIPSVPPAEEGTPTSIFSPAWEMVTAESFTSRPETTVPVASLITTRGRSSAPDTNHFDPGGKTHRVVFKFGGDFHFESGGVHRSAFGLEGFTQGPGRPVPR
jgi:hypothetical protein